MEKEGEFEKDIERLNNSGANFFHEKELEDMGQFIHGRREDLF